jgi:FKBP-type peptidyl-prolyl cis-trans isomerase FklB
MLYIIRITAIFILLSGSCLAGEKPDLANEHAQLSYSIGYQVGGDFKRQEIDIDPQIVLQGIQDAMQGDESAMSNEEMRNTLVELQKSLIEAQKKKSEEMAVKNLAAGRAYLAENSKKADVVTLPSGLQYTIIEAGSGDSPAPTDVVEVNYRGTLIDGTEFDSSYTRGKPAQFRADKVIPGWTEALQLMKKGEKWRLFIPAELAYGNRRMGSIEPNSTLIFDVELLEVKKDMGKESSK